MTNVADIIVLWDCSRDYKDEYRDALKVTVLLFSGGEGTAYKALQSKACDNVDGDTQMLYLRVHRRQKFLLTRIIGYLYWFGYN